MLSQGMPKTSFLLVAFIQGLILFALHQAIDKNIWPHESPQWLFVFYTLSIVIPVIYLLSVNQSKKLRLIKWISLYTITIGLCSYYVGSQLNPYKLIYSGSVIFAFVVTMLIASFKFLIYSQQRLSGKAMSYHQLFAFSWRNFLTLALSLLFTLILWGVLMLWASLFEMIKIKFFHHLFIAKWFLYPVLAMANAYGIYIFRNQTKIIDTITRIQQTLMKFLLLVLVFILLIFLAALPFTGLDPLWQTKSGSALILSMQAITLFFLNGVYQDEESIRPYSLWLHRFIYIGIASLPIYSLISGYGLSLRIIQYGLTVERCWAVFIWFIFSLFSFGYLWGILKKHDYWISILSWVNIRVGLFFLAAMLATNSPFLDFRKMSVSSQISRLNSDAVTYADFDFRYFRRHLALPGYLALQELKSEIKSSDPTVAKQIDDLYTDRHQELTLASRQEFNQLFKVWPKDETLPTDLVDAIYHYAEKNKWSFSNQQQQNIIALDLNSDGRKDYLLIFQNYNGARVFFKKDNNWKNLAVNQQGEWDRAELERLIETNKIEVESPEWKLIKIGNMTFKVYGY